MSVTLALVVSLVSVLVLLFGAMLLGACRSSSEADRARTLAVARARARIEQHRRNYPPYS